MVFRFDVDGTVRRTLLRSVCSQRQCSVHRLDVYCNLTIDLMLLSTFCEP